MNPCGGPPHLTGMNLSLLEALGTTPIELGYREAKGGTIRSSRPA